MTETTTKIEEKSSVPNTGIESGNNATETTTVPIAEQPAVKEQRRLYISNIPYKVDADSLIKFFEGFTIEDVTIPRNNKTGRSYGYAFVDLKNKSDVETALEKIHKKELDDRKVSVHIAKPPSDEPREPRRSSQKSKRNNGSNNSGSSDNIEGKDNEKNDGEEGNNSVKGRGRTNSSANGRRVGGRRPRTQSRRFARVPKKGPPKDGVPSKDTLFVSNLDYNATVDDVKKFFEDYKPEDVKIALRLVSKYVLKKLEESGTQRKGRGFAFVKFGSTENLEKAFKELNGKSLLDRPLTLSIALETPETPESSSSTLGDGEVKETAGIGEKVSEK